MDRGPLIQHSKKRHPVTDTKAYWMLSEFRSTVHSSIRKNALLRGISASDPDDFEIEIDEEDLNSEDGED